MDYNMEIFYLIISKDELNKVDFSQLDVTSIATCLYLDDKQKILLKWTGNTPDFVSSLSYKEGPYKRSEILNIIKDRKPIILSLSTS